MTLRRNRRHFHLTTGQSLSPFLIATLPLFCLLLINCSSSSKPNDAAVRHNNLGVALMDAGVKDPSYFPEAIKEFEAALSSSREYRTAQINLGIACYFSTQTQKAATIFASVLKDDPEELHAHYMLGLIQESETSYAAARSHFLKVTQTDPQDANAWFHLGNCYSKLGSFADAVESYRRAAAIVPYQRAYRYNLFMSLNRAGMATEAQSEFENFKRLESSNIRVVDAPKKELDYLKQGKYAEAVADSLTLPSPPPKMPHYTPVEGSLSISFKNNGTADDAEVQRILSGNPFPRGWFANESNRHKLIGALGSGAAFCDYNNDGRLDLFLVNVNASHALFEQRADGSFQDVTDKVGIGAEPRFGMASAWGDFDNDGWADLLITGYGVMRLYRNEHGIFKDITDTAGISKFISPSTWCFDAAFADIDHDGDLDIYITCFVDLTKPSEKSELRFPDDFTGQSNLLFQNNLNGTFTQIAAQAKADGAGLKSCNVWFSDVNDDRAIDFVLFDFAGNASTFLNMKNGTFSGSNLKPATLTAARPPIGESHAFGDFNADGAVDELINRNGQFAVLRRNDDRPANWLTVRLAGYAVPGQVKSNRMAIGTKVEVRTVGGWIQEELHAGNGQQGCDAPEIYFDLSEQNRADFVRAIFPSGVRWTLRDVASNQTVKLDEPLLDVNSCPVLFAWNGQRFNFISDTIGAGVLDELVAPGEYWKPDPDEWLRLTGDELELTPDRKANLRFVNPLEEVTFLDRVRLLAVDHPAEVEVYPNERMVNEPANRRPIKAYALTNIHPLIKATAQDGADVTEALAKIDRQYAAHFVPKPFKGFAQDWSLTLDLGRVDVPSQTVLLLHSWSYWNSPASIIAAAQAGEELWGPTLDVLGRDGRWRSGTKDLGVSAGLPRTIVMDLSNILRAGEHIVRIRSNRTLYYDQIVSAQKAEQSGLDDAPPPGHLMRLTEVPLAQAQLRWLGYPKRFLPDGKLPEDYDYQQIGQDAEWNTHVGLLTRYGDVLALLERGDDQFVVMENGEEVSLSFDGRQLQELPRGWKRTFLFYSSGYEKTYQTYPADSQSVAPLPTREFSLTYPRVDSRRDEAWRYPFEWNTRPSFIRP